jgi:hypothetical protein
VLALRQQQQPAAAAGEQLASAAGPSKPPLQRPSPTILNALPLPQQPSNLLGKRSREQLLPSMPGGLHSPGLPPPSDFLSPARLQQPSAQLPGSHQQLLRQPQLPRQASLQLPPRRVSPGQGKPSPQSRQATASPASQQQTATTPAVASPEQQQATPSPQGPAQAPHTQHPGSTAAHEAGDQQQQQQRRPLQFKLGPQAWQQGMAVLREQVGHRGEHMGCLFVCPSLSMQPGLA